MTTCRLIIDAPKTGAENMAIDEAILLSAVSAEDPRPTLRLYQWSEPTLSLGYFQPYEARAQHAASRECACVRRHSGGGAIMHDHEVTYSLTVPMSDRWSPRADDLYQQVHGRLVDWFRELGLSAELAQDGDKEPFLCFQRRSEGDIVVDGQKVTGSAQRRHRQAILQHGSILLQRSDAAPELAGLRDLGGLTFSREEFVIAAAGRILDGSAHTATEGSLNQEEKVLSRRLIQDKFGSKLWTMRR